MPTPRTINDPRLIELHKKLARSDNPWQLQDAFQAERDKMAEQARLSRGKNVGLEYQPSPVKGTRDRVLYRGAEDFQRDLRQLIKKGYVDSKGTMDGAELAAAASSRASQDTVSRFVRARLEPLIKNFDFDRRGGTTRAAATAHFKAMVDEVSRFSPQLADQLAQDHAPLARAYVDSLQQFDSKNLEGLKLNLARNGGRPNPVVGKDGITRNLAYTKGASGVSKNPGNYKEPLAGAAQRTASKTAVEAAMEGRYTESLLLSRLGWPKLKSDARAPIEAQLMRLREEGVRYKPTDTYIDELRRGDEWDSDIRGTTPGEKDIVRLARSGDEEAASDVASKLARDGEGGVDMAKVGPARGYDPEYLRARPMSRLDKAHSMIQEGTSQAESAGAARINRSLEKMMERGGGSQDWEALALGSKKTMERAAPTERLLLDAIRRNGGKVPLETAEALGAGSSKILALLGRLAAKIPK